MSDFPPPEPYVSSPKTYPSKLAKTDGKGEWLLYSRNNSIVYLLNIFYGFVRSKFVARDKSVQNTSIEKALVAI